MGLKRQRFGAGLLATAALVVSTAVLLPGASAQSGANPAQLGSFGQPFVEPTIGDFTGYPRVRTDERCVERPPREGTQQGGPTQGFIDCKPAAGGMNMLPNGKTLYWDNLAGTENVELSILSEYGVVGLNDQSRLMDAAAHKWTEPSPVDGGAKSKASIAPATRTASPPRPGASG